MNYYKIQDGNLHVILCKEKLETAYTVGSMFTIASANKEAMVNEFNDIMKQNNCYNLYLFEIDSLTAEKLGIYRNIYIYHHYIPKRAYERIYAYLSNNMGKCYKRYYKRDMDCFE